MTEDDKWAEDVVRIFELRSAEYKEAYAAYVEARKNLVALLRSVPKAAP